MSTFYKTKIEEERKRLAKIEEGVLLVRGWLVCCWVFCCLLFWLVFVFVFGFIFCTNSGNVSLFSTFAGENLPIACHTCRHTFTVRLKLANFLKSCMQT